MKNRWLKIVGPGIFLVLLLFVTGKLFFEQTLEGFLSRFRNGKRIELSDESLIIGLASELTTLDPVTKEAQTREWISQIYEGLVRTDENLKVEPSLAVTYGAIDDTTWEFRLRPNVFFHDGTALGFEDVEESLKAANEPTIKEIKKIDGERFYIITEDADPLLPQKLAAIFIFPKSSKSTLLTKPVGTGPYKFQSLENGVMKLGRFERYWGEAPAFAQAELVSVPDREARVHALAEGKIHILAHVPPEIVPEFSYEQYLLLTQPTLESNFLLFGFRGPFQSRKLRQAAFMAFDRNEVAKLAFGFARSANQFVGNGIFGYHPSIELPETDPKGALEIVQSLGAGKIKFSLDLPEGFNALGEFLKDKFKRVGFEPELHFLNPEALEEKALGGKSDLYFFGWRSELGDSGSFLNEVVHSRSRGFGQFNGGGYANGEIDRLIERSNAILSPLERLEKLRQVMKTVTEEDMIGIPLFIPEVLYAVRDGRTWIPRFDGYILANTVK